MKKLFITFSAAFGAIPGLVVLSTELGVPPGQSKLFGAIIEAFGVLSLMILWINRGKLARAAARKVTTWAVTLGMICFVCLLLYVVLFKLCVISDPYRGIVLFPLWLSGKLNGMVILAGSRNGALVRYGYDAVREAAQNAPLALGLTTALLITIYQAIFTSLALAFGLLGIKADEKPRA